MLRQSVNSLRYQCAQLAYFRSMTTDATKGKWDLLVGVQIERLPIISKSLNKLEREYQDLLLQIEFENSYKSDFEVKHENDVKTAKLLKEGKMKMDLDAVASLTASDLMDLWKEERSKFQPASRTTKADETNDLQSIDRKLEDPLTLIVEQTLGKDKLFLLPQGKIADGETLYQAAERIIKEHCGDELQTQIYGKAPCGFYKFKYPKEIRGEKIGAKVFFYRAIWKAGKVDEKLKNFEWLDKDELLKKVDKHRAYQKSLSQFII